MIFLITRPQHQAENLCRALEQAGGKCILFPTIAIVPHSAEVIQPAIAHLPSPPHKVIFTSANAVYPVMPLWSSIQPAPSVFAIGSGTASALSHFQIHAETPIPGQFHSEGLLSLPTLQQVQQQNIVIFSGEGGRHLLQKTLQQRGANVTKIAVYQRQLPAATPLPIQEKITLIICTSKESLQNLWDMADANGKFWLQQQRLLVINHAMAQLATELGFKQQPIVADNASDEAVLAAISFYVKL